MASDAVQIISTECGLGLQAKRAFEAGIILFEETPLVCISEADMMDMALCEDVLGLPETPRYSKIGLLLLEKEGIANALTFCEGRHLCKSAMFTFCLLHS